MFIEKLGHSMDKVSGGLTTLVPKIGGIVLVVATILLFFNLFHLKNEKKRDGAKTTIIWIIVIIVLALIGMSGILTDVNTWNAVKDWLELN